MTLGLNPNASGPNPARPATSGAVPAEPQRSPSPPRGGAGARQGGSPVRRSFSLASWARSASPRSPAGAAGEGLSVRMCVCVRHAVHMLGNQSCPVCVNWPHTSCPVFLQATLRRHGLTSSSRPARVQQQQQGQRSAWMRSSSVRAAAAQAAWPACLAAAAPCLPTPAGPSRAAAQQLQPRQVVRPRTTCSSRRCGRTSRAGLGGRGRLPPTRCAAATQPPPVRWRLVAAAGQARPAMQALWPAAPGPHLPAPPRWSRRQRGGRALAAPTHPAALCRPTARHGARSGSRCEALAPQVPA